MFDETSYGYYRPRNLMIDTDDSTMSNTQASTYARIFSPDHYICKWKHESTGSYAAGYYNNDEIKSRTIEKVRQLHEGCDNLEAFQIFHSISGGTGSGLTSLLQSEMKDLYPSSICANHVVIPYETWPAGSMEVYNAVLAMWGMIENSSLTFMYNNEALLKLSQTSPTYNIMLPSFAELNSIIAQQATNLTASFRFPGTLNSTFRKLATNITPFPRLHFLTLSHSNLKKRNFDRPDFLNMTTTEVLTA
jgi:hypothetical protein